MFKIKIPKLKFPKMGKRRKRMLMVSLIALSFFVAGGIMFGEAPIKDLFDYAGMSYTINVLGFPNTLEEGETVTVLYNDIVTIEVVAAWDTSMTYNYPPEIQCKIFGGPFGLYYQDIAWATPDNAYAFRWTFDLKDIPTGNFDYRFEFVGYYPTIANPTVIYDGTSFTFYIDKTAEVIPDEPSIWVGETDFEMRDDETKELVWQYQYGSSGTIYLSVDGVVEDTIASKVSSASQIYRFVFDPPAVGTYDIKFSLDPDYEGHSNAEQSIVGTVVSREDYDMLQGLPDAIEPFNIELTGVVAFIGFPVRNVWSVVGSPPIMTPYDGRLTVVIYSSGFSSNSLRVISPDGTETDHSMTGAIGTRWVELPLETWEAGDYTVELIGVYSGATYRITTFILTVRAFPALWLVQIGLLFTALSVLAIVTIRFLREVSGWWGYKGKYVK